MLVCITDIYFSQFFSYLLPVLLHRKKSLSECVPDLLHVDASMVWLMTALNPCYKSVVFAMKNIFLLTNSYTATYQRLTLVSSAVALYCSPFLLNLSTASCPMNFAN